MRKNPSYTDVLLCYFVTFCLWIATWMTAVNSLWSDLRSPLFLPFEVPSQGTSPSPKGKS